MIKYISTLHYFELTIWSILFLSLASIFAAITNFNRVTDSISTNPYTLIVATIFLVVFGDMFLGELIFRFFRFLKNKFVQ